MAKAPKQRNGARERVRVNDARILKDAIGLPKQLVEGYKIAADSKLAENKGN
jgi:hypothetical protein